MAVNMKLGVDLGSFNSGINQAKAQLKTFDAALKSAESQFKATGDAESALTTKMSALSSKLSTQKRIVDDYRRALETMTKNNVDPLSNAYQKMQKEMLLAEAAMYDTQAALNELNSSEQQAAVSADQLTKSVNGIGKKMSLDQVISGINKITDGLENAAKKAVDFGATLFREIMEQAGEADDILTKSIEYGYTPERYQAMTKLAATWAETSVEAIVKARERVQNNIGDITDVLLGIGVDPYKNKKKILGTDRYTGELKDWEDVFWEAGDALLHLGRGYEQTQKAQDIFGRKWEELMPMFQMGREEYEKTLNAEEVNAAETIERLAKLNDTVNALKLDFSTLEKEVLAGMAPALTAGAEALNGVLSELIEYLQKPEGQEMLNKLGESVSSLFNDLTKINPEDVVSNFVTVFDQLTKGLEFLANNWDKVVNGIKEIGIAFGLLKIGEGVLEGLRLINGFKNLTGAGGGDQTQTTGTKTGGLNSKIMNGIGAMVVVDWDPSRVREIEKETGSKRDALAKYLDELNGSNLYELQQEWENNKTKNSGGNFLKQVMDSPKNLAEVVWGWITGKGTAGDWSGENGDDWSVKVKPEAEEGSAEDLAQQIGEVTVPVNLRVNMGGGAFSGGGGGGGQADYFMDSLFGSFRPGYANGIAYVPNKRLAWLHPGETVTPARAVESRSYNSNLYVERMIMNNGTDAAGLASAMAAAQRRTMSGYGS